MKDRWEVYIIKNAKGMLYTGITNNLERRFNNHSQGRGARFFHFSPAAVVVFREPQINRSEASKREAMIKKMKREEKLALIKTAESLD